MHILIVEDELGIVQFLQQGLQEEGYQITTANDGSKGFELIQEQHFDLILLDWMLPKINGLDLCKAIRIKDQTTPIICGSNLISFFLQTLLQKLNNT